MTKKLIELLFACGISPLPRAKVLAHFIHSKGVEITSRQLERDCDLRQPEVSLALSAFLDRKWITEKPPKETPEKKGGRPTKLYVLGIPPDAIYLSISKTIEKDYKDKSELLVQLKTAMISPKPAVSESSVKKEQQTTDRGLRYPFDLIIHLRSSTVKNHIKYQDCARDILASISRDNSYVPIHEGHRVHAPGVGVLRRRK